MAFVVRAFPLKRPVAEFQAFVDVLQSEKRADVDGSIGEFGESQELGERSPERRTRVEVPTTEPIASLVRHLVSQWTRPRTLTAPRGIRSPSHHSHLQTTG